MGIVKKRMRGGRVAVNDLLGKFLGLRMLGIGGYMLKVSVSGKKTGDRMGLLKEGEKPRL